MSSWFRRLLELYRSKPIVLDWYTDTQTALLAGRHIRHNYKPRPSPKRAYHKSQHHAWAEAQMGRFHLKDTILDQIKLYLDYVRRMKKGDPDAFGYYSKVGAHLMPWGSYVCSLETPPPLAPWFRKTLPGFGAIAWGIDPELEREEQEDAKVYYPKFMWFTKCQTPPSRVQPINEGVVYKVTVYWDKIGRRKDPGRGAPQEFAVVIPPEGEPRLLKIHLRSFNTVIGKHGHNRGQEIRIPRNYWGVPDTFKRWADLHKIPVETYLHGIFIETANTFERLNMGMFRVRVGRDNLWAVFGIDPKRAPYFFADREVEALTATGRRKPIAHIVRPHEVHRNDKTYYRKIHFRGEKDFEWNGYKVEIRIPGWDHYSVAEFDIGSVEGEDHPHEDLIGAPEMGREWAKHITRGFDYLPFDKDRRFKSRSGRAK